MEKSMDLGEPSEPEREWKWSVCDSAKSQLRKQYFHPQGTIKSISKTFSLFLQAQAA